LEALTRTNDGLELAELDLRLRGPGDYFGVQQSGLVERFRFARCATEGVIGDVDRAANDVDARDPDLSTPEMSGLAQAVSAFGQAKERA
jgi:ATP-dependent DNA helicase RecG